MIKPFNHPGGLPLNLLQYVIEYVLNMYWGLQIIICCYIPERYSYFKVKYMTTMLIEKYYLKKWNYVHSHFQITFLCEIGWEKWSLDELAGRYLWNKITGRPCWRYICSVSTQFSWTLYILIKHKMFILCTTLWVFIQDENYSVVSRSCLKSIMNIINISKCCFVNII